MCSNMLRADARLQYHSIYKKYYLKRVWEAIDTDMIFQQLMQTVKDDFITYFESKKMQGAFEERVVQSIGRIQKDLNFEEKKSHRLVDQMRKTKQEEHEKHIASLDPIKLEQKVKELELKLARQQKQYLKELEHQRQAEYLSQKQMLLQTRSREEFISVKFFDMDELLFAGSVAVEPADAGRKNNAY